jgi:hypothetical protein
MTALPESLDRSDAAVSDDGKPRPVGPARRACRVHHGAQPVCELTRIRRTRILVMITTGAGHSAPIRP